MQHLHVISILKFDEIIQGESVMTAFLLRSDEDAVAVHAFNLVFTIKAVPDFWVA